MWKVTTSSSLVFLIFLIAMCRTEAVMAGSWMAHADFSGCPSQYVSGTGEEGPFNSEAECEARINSINQLACASYKCVDEGGDSSSSSNSGSSSIPSGGNSQTEMLMQGGYMLGQSIRAAMERKKQQEQAEAAAEAAAAQAAAQRAQEKLDADTKVLLGEVKGGDSTDLSLKTTDAPAMVPTAQPSAVPHPQDAAYVKGQADAADCMPQNAGGYCAGVPADATLACNDQYHHGYAVGEIAMKNSLQAAWWAGKQDRAANHPASFSQGTQGKCGVHAVEAYQSGYNDVPMTSIGR